MPFCKENEKQYSGRMSTGKKGKITVFKKKTINNDKKSMTRAEPSKLNYKVHFL